MARPRFAPTDAQKFQVELLAGCGMPQEHICSRITNPDSGQPIDRKTLRRAFRAQLDSGAITANATVAQNLFKHATGSGAQAVSAAKFWLQCRGGWKPTEGLTVAHSGVVGAVDLAQWVTQEQQEAVAREILRGLGYEFGD